MKYVYVWAEKENEVKAAVEDAPQPDVDTTGFTVITIDEEIQIAYDMKIPRWQLDVVMADLRKSIYGV